MFNNTLPSLLFSVDFNIESKINYYMKYTSEAKPPTDKTQLQVENLNLTTILKYLTQM